MDRNSSDAVTKPTLDTILERINLVGDSVIAVRDELGVLRTEVGVLRDELGVLRTEVGVLRDELGALRIDIRNLRKEFQLFRADVEIRLDRAEGMTNHTRAEMLTLRADFTESRSQQKDPST
jgi:regulator of replication initiation timing